MNGVMVHDNREILPTRARWRRSGRAPAAARRVRAKRRATRARGGRPRPGDSTRAGSTDRADGSSERGSRQCGALSQHLGPPRQSGTAHAARADSGSMSGENVHEPSTIHSRRRRGRGRRGGAPPVAARAQRTAVVGANDRVRMAIIGSGSSRQSGADVVCAGAEQRLRRRVRRVQGATRRHRPEAL